MVVSGRKGEIAAETERLLADHDAMDLINNHFIPALDEVGVLFDQGKFFCAAYGLGRGRARGLRTIKRLMPAGEIAEKGKICVATSRATSTILARTSSKCCSTTTATPSLSWAAMLIRRRYSRP